MLKIGQKFGINEDSVIVTADISESGHYGRIAYTVVLVTKGGGEYVTTPYGNPSEAWQSAFSWWETKYAHAAKYRDMSDIEYANMTKLQGKIDEAIRKSENS